jgi:hypothetical protein
VNLLAARVGDSSLELEGEAGTFLRHCLPQLVLMWVVLRRIPTALIEHLTSCEPG